jgi:cytochrome P450
VSTDSYDLTDQQLYSRGDQYAVWAAMRHECPVAWCDPDDHDPFWAVSTYHAGLEVLTDWRKFSAAKGTMLRPDMSVPYPGGGTMLALTDPPRHTLLRKALAFLFTPRAVARLEDHIRSFARAQVNRVIELGRCDFTKDIAAKFPLASSAELLSVGHGDVERLLGFANIVAESGADISGRGVGEAHFEIMRYYADALALSASAPVKGVAGGIVAAFRDAQSSGFDISDGEIILSCDNVLNGAAETTRQTASSGLLALLQHPDQMRALRRGEASFEYAVEEILRWTVPVHHILRTATTDTKLMKAEIRAGQPVSIWISSMNRDEAVFDHSEEFVVSRQPGRHLAFGGPVHVCLGAALARVTIRVLLEELIGKTSEITLAGQPTYVHSHSIGGVSSLPIYLRPR